MMIISVNGEEDKDANAARAYAVFANGLLNRS